LREVEIRSDRIVNPQPRERAIAGPLGDFDMRPLLRDARPHEIDVLDLNAEVIQAGLPSAHARIDVHADVAVADCERSGVEFGRRTRLEVEQTLIKDPLCRVVVRHDRDVVQFCKHGDPLNFLADEVVERVASAAAEENRQRE
jgi:hypothetical protein